MTELLLLLEVQRFLFFAFEVIRYFKHRQREKELLDSVESNKQFLSKLEKFVKTLKFLEAVWKIKN